MPQGQPRQSLKSSTALTPAAMTAFMPGLPDGIYLNLSNERYHADTALGSSNIRDLLKGPNLFWHKSWLNPKRVRDELTPSKIVGNATHRLLLDGRQPFEEEYIRGPYGPDEDLSSADKSALTKAAKKKLLAHQELLAQVDYDFVVGCKQVLDQDPELQGCLDNGLSEVSIFWTRPDGIRCKVRLDKLKIGAIGDIKTIANERERPIEDACLLDIHTYRYDIPVEHYSEGRRQMAALLAAGKVFIEIEDNEVEADEPTCRIVQLKPDKNPATDIAVKTLDFLNACAKQKNFGFQLVFIPKKGAPDAWSCVVSPGNPLLKEARSDIETALGYFARAAAQFGDKKRWLPGHAVCELTPDMLPIGFGRARRNV